MICSFFGHHNASDKIRSTLELTIKHLMSQGVNDFLVGNNGNFDYLAQCVLSEYSKKYGSINFTVVFSNINEHAIFANCHQTIFPEGLEKAPPRFRISKRNDWMLRRSQIVIFYLKNQFSNNQIFLKKLKKWGYKQ